MTQEEKELLLKDLLGRVLYGVKVDYHTSIFTLGYNLYLNNTDVAFENYPMLYFLENIESVKPYLRPMSSMTDEERNELSHYDNSVQRTDFFYSHHIDCRFMIEKGLALEAPKDMYKF